jgi:hypothetical protein
MVDGQNVAVSSIQALTNFMVIPRQRLNFRHSWRTSTCTNNFRYSTPAPCLPGAPRRSVLAKPSASHSKGAPFIASLLGNVVVRVDVSFILDKKEGVILPLLALLLLQYYRIPLD